MRSKDTSSDEDNPPVNRLDTSNHEGKPPGNGEGTSSNGEKPSLDIMNTSSVSDEDSNPQTKKGNMEWKSLRMNELPVIGYPCLLEELWDRQGANIASR